MKIDGNESLDSSEPNRTHEGLDIYRGSSATTMVTHSHGQEAGALAGQANRAVQNVALVYIDARGVTRKALLKSAGKAAVRGRMNDGREVVFGTDANVDQWTEKAEVDDKKSRMGPGSSNGK